MTIYTDNQKNTAKRLILAGASMEEIMKATHMGGPAIQYYRRKWKGASAAPRLALVPTPPVTQLAAVGRAAMDAIDAQLAAVEQQLDTLRVKRETLMDTFDIPRS